MEKTFISARYDRRALLGTGGMAKVYLAHDELLGREVALKVLREQYAEDEGFVERFGREARSVAALSHPNIVQIYDRGCSEDGLYYIVMELVRGGTLKERLRAEGPLGHAEAARLAAQMAGALGAAHERGVIHRDVKSQNVLLAEGGRAKVADFGIARAASVASISRTDRILGTPNYMSPEQAQGKPADPRSDLYSLGVVFYEMLTGALPFEADTPVAVSMKHVNEPATPLREANPGVPEALDAVVLKLLSKDPEDRYASAEALIEELRRVSDGLAGIGRGDEPTLPLLARATGTRRRRRVPLLLSSVAVVGALLGGAYLWQSPEGPGIAGSLEGVSEEARRALEGGGRVVGLVEVAKAAQVPDVVGLSAEEAEKRLADVGFESEQRPRESSEEDFGKVLEQSVEAGKGVEEGSIILLAVGAGPRKTEETPAPPVAAAPTPGAGAASAPEQQYGVGSSLEEPIAPAPVSGPEPPVPTELARYEKPAQYEEPAVPAPAPAEEPISAPVESVQYDEPPAPAPVPTPQYEEPVAPGPEQQYYEEPASYQEPSYDEGLGGEEREYYEDPPQEYEGEDSSGEDQDDDGDD